MREDHPERALELSMGQTKVRRGEAIMAIIMAKLFPGEWLRNTRPQFLAEKTGRSLELDGFCPDQQLAWEHQGLQHRDEKITETDEVKASACKDHGVRLIVVWQKKLDPDSYLAAIKGALDKASLKPEISHVDTDEVLAEYEAYASNPHKKWRKDFLELVKHKILTPHSKILPRSQLLYECNNCNTHVIIARADSYRPETKGCQNCLGEIRQQSGRRKRMEALRTAEDLPPALRAVLDVSKSKGVVYHCPNCSAKVKRSSLEWFAKLCKDGQFACPSCSALASGRPDYIRQPSFNHTIDRNTSRLARLGLTVLTVSTLDGSETPVCVVKCAEGHESSWSSDEIRHAEGALSSELKGDPKIDCRLTCPECRYPNDPSRPERGITIDGQTVSQRLAILRTIYPKAHYISGFDRSSWKKENYSCGESFLDGTPHKPFLITGREFAHLKRSYCFACAVRNDWQLNRKEITLADVECRMHAKRDLVFPGAVGSPPTVTKIGRPAGTGVHSRETRLIFNCGVAGHEPSTNTDTYSNYFNRGRRRKGFCPDCQNRVP